MATNLALTSTVTIANGGTVSTTLSIPSGSIPLAILIPSVMTGTAMTFKASPDNGVNFYPIYFESTSYSVTIPTGAIRHIALDRRAFECVTQLQCVSGSAEGAQRTIGVITGR